MDTSRHYRRFASEMLASGDCSTATSLGKTATEPREDRLKLSLFKAYRSIRCCGDTMRRVNGASSFCPIAKERCVPIAPISPYRSGNAQPRGYTSTSIFGSTRKASPLASRQPKHSAVERGPTFISRIKRRVDPIPSSCGPTPHWDLLAFWWIGTRDSSRAARRLTITQLPRLSVLDPRTLSKEQIVQAEVIFETFKGKIFLPANEAYRDKTRQALDRAVLVNLLHFPEDVLEPLAILRDQWCAEPSVHGGKKIRGLGFSAGTCVPVSTPSTLSP